MHDHKSTQHDALVESAMYAGTNEGLHYKDVSLGLLAGKEGSKAELLIEVTLRMTEDQRCYGVVRSDRVPGGAAGTCATLGAGTDRSPRGLATPR
jgi:hypothetical protein